MKVPLHLSRTLIQNTILGGPKLTIAVALFLSAFSAVHADLDLHYKDDDSGFTSHPDWMSRLPGHMRLCDLTIPGTHDSGSDNWGTGATISSFGQAQTQVLSITQMLNFGIRHFDVRLQHDGDTFDVIHGEYDMGSTYRELVTECYSFLALHPGETIILDCRVLPETAGSPSTTAEALFKVIHAQHDALYQPPGGTRIWPNEQTLRPDGKASTHAVRTVDAPPPFTFEGITTDVTKDSLIKYIPTLSEVRGKIVFMGPDSVPTNAVAYGYPAGSKADFYPNVFSVRDNYRITETRTPITKWDEDQAWLDKVIKDRPPGEFYFTWLNAAVDEIVAIGPAWTKNPDVYAYFINRWTLEYRRSVKFAGWRAAEISTMRNPC